MSLTSFSSRRLVIATLLIFALATGCVTVSDEASRPKREAIVPSLITIEPATDRPLETRPLREGEPAPGDGVWVSKESAIRVAEDRVAHLGLKKKVLVQNEIVKAYVAQLNILYEANDLQIQANQQLRKEIESQRKWSTVKNWASVVGVVGGFIAAMFLSK